MIEYKCLKCGATMSSPSSMAGKLEQCPYCGAVRGVPEPPAGGPSRDGGLRGRRRPKAPEKAQTRR